MLNSISDIRIIGFDKNRPPQVRKENYIDLFFQLSQQAPAEWCEQFNKLGNQLEPTVKVNKSDGIILETWIRDMNLIQVHMDKIKEKITLCTQQMLQNIKQKELDALAKNTSIQGQDGEQNKLNLIVASLDYGIKWLNSARSIPINYFLIFFSIAFSSAAYAEKLNCPCKVVRILNGDTVHVIDQLRSSRKVWMAGIVAPAMDDFFGERSRLNLNKIVDGQPVEVEYIQRDRYGRIIGKLLLQGRDINLQQIKDGYAIHYKPKSENQSEKDRAIYQAAEIQAKQKKTGLWSLTDNFSKNQ